jgi:ATP-dependent RNA helicase DDX55/SPB4
VSQESKTAIQKKKREQKAKNTAWSEKVGLKESRDKRKEKSARKRKRENEKKTKNEEGEDDDLRELVEDERLARKAKRAKLIAAGSSKAFMEL